MTAPRNDNPENPQGLTVQRQQLANVRKLLEDSRAGLAMALPKHVPAEYMMRVVLTSVQRTPKLLECHPITLIGAVFQAAQLGLVPDGVLGQAYLVPFLNRKKRRLEVQFIPGYKGLISLARRSGEVSTIGAEVVHKKDVFKYSLGINPILEHTPTDDPDPGPITHVYAFAKLKDGGFQIVVMNMRQVNGIKARSASVQSGHSSPWDTDPEWMIKKTALKQLCKLLPASTELQRAVALEERAEIGLPQDLSLLADPDNEAATPEDEQDAAGEDQRNPLEEELAALDGELQEKLRDLFNRVGYSQGQALAALRQHKTREKDLIIALQEQLYAKLAGGSTAQADKPGPAPSASAVGTTADPRAANGAIPSVPNGGDSGHPTPPLGPRPVPPVAKKSKFSI